MSFFFSIFSRIIQILDQISICYFDTFPESNFFYNFIPGEAKNKHKSFLTTDINPTHYISILQSDSILQYFDSILTQSDSILQYFAIR